MFTKRWGKKWKYHDDDGRDCQIVIKIYTFEEKNHHRIKKRRFSNGMNTQKKAIIAVTVDK